MPHLSILSSPPISYVSESATIKTSSKTSLIKTNYCEDAVLKLSCKQGRNLEDEPPGGTPIEKTSEKQVVSLIV